MEGKNKARYRIAILTVSDKASRGEREDLCAPLIQEMVGQVGEVVAYAIVPDEQEEIVAKLKEFCDDKGVDLVLTTGGTGFGPRDVTPEATLAVIEREAPGLPEAMRSYGLKSTPLAMLSRARAGIRGKALIINLPGSPAGVKEGLSVLLPALDHGLAILKGQAGECTRPRSQGDG